MGAEGDELTNYINNIVKVLMSASQTATLRNTQNVTIGQNIIIINNKGEIYISSQGNTQVYVDIVSTQSTYFSGTFDTEIIQVIAQIVESITGLFGGSGSDIENIMELITEIAYETNLMYQMQCQTDIAIRSNAVIVNNENLVDLNYDGDTTVDSASNCVLNSTSIIDYRLRLEQYLSQDISTKKRSFIGGLVVAVVLLVLLFGFLTITGYSLLIKFAVFSVVIVLVVVGLYLLSAFLIGLPPFGEEESDDGSSSDPANVKPYDPIADGPLPEHTGYTPMLAKSGMHSGSDFVVDSEGYVNIVLPCFSYRYSPNRIRVEVRRYTEAPDPPDDDGSTPPKPPSQLIGSTTLLISSNREKPAVVYPIWLRPGHYNFSFGNIGPDAAYFAPFYVERSLIANSSFIFMTQLTTPVSIDVEMSSKYNSTLLVRYQDENTSWIRDKNGNIVEVEYSVSQPSGQIIHIEGINPNDYAQEYYNPETGEIIPGKAPKYYSIIFINDTNGGGEIIVHLESNPV